MKADDLHDLIRHSSSTRRYFLSLPVGMQMDLHEKNEHIRTAEELHRFVDYLSSTGFQ